MLISQKSFIILLLLAFQSVSVSSQVRIIKRNYFFNQYQEKGGLSAFSNVEAWRANRKGRVLSEIKALPKEVKDSLVKRGEELLKTEWKVLKLTDYIDKSASLGAFGKPSAERHEKLTFLVIAELIEGKERFMPEIANGLWLTLEESTWVLPGSLVLQKAGYGLPDPNETIIDLRSGDLVTMVAWIRCLLYDELKAISPLLIDRIDVELAERIFTPYLSTNDMKWMGFNNQRTNNWNIWINTNILLSAVLTLDDEKLRNEIIAKTILSADNFLNQYPEDGGVDEGIGYWKHAGGRLIEFVSLLTDLSENKLNWRNNELIHNIGAYTYKTHIKGKYFVNFADAPAISVPTPYYLYKYGEMFDDAVLKNFASFMYNQEYAKGNDFADETLNTFINNIETYKLIQLYPAESPMLKQNWLPDLQVLTLREKEGSTDGFFFGVKGGHNGESHNHNDVGSFVLYTDGKPAFIDVGVGVYTKQTFGKDRYKIWTMQSQWHNCPTINGVMQKNGVIYKAENVKYVNGGGADVFSLNIAGAYPKEAKVKSWDREFTFSSKKGSLILKEKYVLDTFVKPFEVHFMTSMLVENTEKGRLKLHDGKKGITLDYDPSLFEVVVVVKQTKDSKLAKVWGKEVRRITFKSLSTAKVGSHSFIFSPTSIW